MGGCITSQRERSPVAARRAASVSQSGNTFNGGSDSREVTTGSRYDGGE